MANLTGRKDEAVRRLRAGELVRVGLDFLALAAEIDGLAHEIALEARVRRCGAELVGFAVGIPGEAVRIADAEALVDLRVDPQFRASPQTKTGIERGVGNLAGLAAMRQAVLSLIERADGGIALYGGGHLAMDGDVVRVDQGRRFGILRRSFRIVIELVVYAKPHFIQREVRGKALAREGNVVVSLP